MKKNPFLITMPPRLNLLIRFRLWREAVRRRVGSPLRFALAVGAPALAAIVLFVSIPGPTDTTALAAEIYEAQEAERARSETGIYHVKRIISEGKDKPAFVAYLTGASATAPVRSDEVETFQHGRNALALIRSNGTERPFEVFLARADAGRESLHHFGPKRAERLENRRVFDRAHDLASLYESYRSLGDRPLPLLSQKAELVTVDRRAGVVQFETAIGERLVLVSTVSLDTKQVVAETIYVLDRRDRRYEMTTITYTERSVLPASEFDSIFSPTRYEYELVAETAA
jgi:hypothetical protein